jgi:CubicO group peptidase (beta-lactamase class C family)
MRRILLQLVLAAAASMAAAAQPPGPIPVDQDPRGVARRLDDYMGRLVPFGYSGVLLVAKGDQIVLANGYGLADRENGVPVTAETVFDIGSVTKQFTAAAILKLEMEGRLRVDDPLSRWFADVPADKAGITLHHLLTHSSGLRGQFGGDYEVAERDSLARVILQSELLWAPGTRYEYSNAGYSLLAMVVEKASGTGYEAYMREKLWAPAGMTRTGYRGVAWRPGELAVGYLSGGRRDGTPVEQSWAPDGPWWNLRGNGGVLSTLGDLFLWNRALAGDAVLSAEAKRKMWTPHVPENDAGTSHYGYGWAISRTPVNTTEISHNGSNGVFFAAFNRYVEQNVVVLAMSNTTDGRAQRTLPTVMRLVFMGGEVTEPPAIVESAPARAAALAGTYTLPGGGTFTVAVAEERWLRIQPEGQEAYALLNGGSAEPRLGELGARAVEVLQAARRGDFAPLHAAFGEEQPLEQVRADHEDFMGAYTESMGALQGVEHVGTAVLGRGASTMVRLRFERGTRFLRIGWEDGAISGIRRLRELPPALFVPVEGDAWVSYDLVTGASGRVRFQDGALLVDTPAGPVRASRGG